jgi:hypothetical protein
VDRSILVLGTTSVDLCTDASISITCTDIYGHVDPATGEERNWFGGIEEMAGVMGNICADPLFCNPAVDLSLHEDSPCNAACGLMGAAGIGCGGSASIGEAVRESSWGTMKRMWNP